MDHGWPKPKLEREPSDVGVDESSQAGVLIFSADDLLGLEARASMLGATAVWRNNATEPIRIIRHSDAAPPRPAKPAARSSVRRTVSTNTKRRTGKRQPDKVMHRVRLLARASWLLAIATLCMVALARPEQRWAFDNFTGTTRRTWWNDDMLQAASFMPLVMFTVCVVGLWLNSKRMRREGDRYDRSILTSGTISLVAFALGRWLI